MKKNEVYWLNLYKDGKIEINFETGDVFSYLSGNKHLLNSHHTSGYLQASAGDSRSDRNYILLHRLIWIVANGEIPEKIEINHKNGIKNDNRLSNLELTDKPGNAIHSHRVLGNKAGMLRGEEIGTSKLKASDVRMIRQQYKKGVITLKFLAKEYGVHFITIRDIIHRKSWKWM